jgi:hypothetical protein
MFIKNFRIPFYAFSLAVSLILCALFSYLYFSSDSETSDKVTTFYAGFASAFLVAFFQQLAYVLDALKLHKYQSMGVEDFLQERRDHKYYEEVINRSNRHITVLGVTASRFMEDFANTSSPNTRALISALSRGVKVKILLPKLAHLPQGKHADITEKTEPAIAELATNANYDIEVKYFDHIPAHSIVATEHTCIAGPVFSHLESKLTQSMVLKPNSEFANQYMGLFDKEWNAADANHS